RRGVTELVGGRYRVVLAGHHTKRHDLDAVALEQPHHVVHRQHYVAPVPVLVHHLLHQALSTLQVQSRRPHDRALGASPPFGVTHNPRQRVHRTFRTRIRRDRPERHGAVVIGDGELVGHPLHGEERRDDGLLQGGGRGQHRLPQRTRIRGTRGGHRRHEHDDERIHVG